MAIHPSEEGSPHNGPVQPIDIHAWTEQATVAISQMAITSPGDAPGATVSLQIPLDDADDADEPPAPKKISVMKRKVPLRRDSLKRREALKMGNEGSRRRQRWENDRLLANPYAEPPTAKDWEVNATHPVHHVPYYLAPLWDAGLARQSTERVTAVAAAKPARVVAKKPTEAGIVPKELRDKLKKARGAKGLLMDLESEVRAFVESYDEKQRLAAAEGIPLELDSDDEEIVFVGRNGQMNDERKKDEVQREMMVFETPASDQGGTFGRWLVHHLGTYYGLRTWSVTRGNPAVREAYIGVKEEARGGCLTLPRPLYGLV